MNTRLRVGLVGLGSHMRQVIIPSIVSSASCDIVAGTDSNSGAVAEFCRLWPTASGYNDIKEMLTEARPDAIFCAAGPVAHEAAAFHAIGMGIPVFVEKPPALSVGTLTTLADQAASTGTITGVGMNFRRCAPLRWALSALDGAASKPRSIYVRYFCKRRTYIDEQQVADIPQPILADAIHAFDMVAFLVEAPSISAATVAQIDGNLRLNVIGAGQADVDWTLSFSDDVSRFRFDVTVVYQNGTLSSLSLPAYAEIDRGVAMMEGKAVERWEPRAMEAGLARAGYQGEVLDFLAAVRAREGFSPSVSDLMITYRLMHDAINTAGLQISDRTSVAQRAVME